MRLPPGPVLVLDAAGSSVRVGLLGAAGRDCWRDSDDEALVALFRATRELLTEAGLRLADLAAFVLNRGPGSVLGLRLAALAVATWNPPGPNARPVLAYRSLDAAAAAALAGGIAAPFTVVADFKEGRWITLRVADATAPLAALPLVAIGADEPAASPGGRILHLPMRKRWRPPPAGAEPFTPPASALAQALRAADLLQPFHGPTDLELGPPPVYRLWSGDRHRAPATASADSTPAAPAVPPAP